MYEFSCCTEKAQLLVNYDSFCFKGPCFPFFRSRIAKMFNENKQTLESANVAIAVNSKTPWARLNA